MRIWSAQVTIARFLDRGFYELPDDDLVTRPVILFEPLADGRADDCGLGASTGIPGLIRLEPIRNCLILFSTDLPVFSASRSIRFIVVEEIIRISRASCL